MNVGEYWELLGGMPEPMSVMDIVMDYEDSQIKLITGPSRNNQQVSRIELSAPRQGTFVG